MRDQLSSLRRFVASNPVPVIAGAVVLAGAAALATAILILILSVDVEGLRARQKQKEADRLAAVERQKADAEAKHQKRLDEIARQSVEWKADLARREAERKAKQPRPERRRVTREHLGDRWPLTVDSGEVECVDGVACYFHHDGTVYALNGVASGPFKGRPAGASIEAIWKENPEIQGARISIKPLLDVAMNSPR